MVCLQCWGWNPGPHTLDNNYAKKFKRQNFGKWLCQLRESFMIESQWLYGAREGDNTDVCVLLPGCPQNLGYIVWTQPPKL